MYADGELWRAAKRFEPHLSDFRVSTPVTGVVPLATAHSLVCMGLSSSASEKSAPVTVAPVRSLSVSTTRLRIALVKSASTKTLRSIRASDMSLPVKSTWGAKLHHVGALEVGVAQLRAPNVGLDEV